MAKVICIDDDRDVLESCKVVLEAQGHEVATAGGGKEGLELAKEFGPDLILLDVMMDDQTDGFHTAYAFRQDEGLKFVPILMLTSINEVTGMGFDKDKDGSFLPVDEFVEKPIEPQKLIELSSKLLALPKDKINVEGK